MLPDHGLSGDTGPGVRRVPWRRHRVGRPPSKTGKDTPMSYPQQPSAWSDPAGGGYVDPATGQPAYPASPPGYGSPGYAAPDYNSPGYAPPGYAPQPTYPATAYPGGAYPGYAPPVLAPAQSTNGMAIASLVLSLCGLVSCGLTGLVGAILGHVSRRQIRERGEGGDGLALAGIISGWIIFGLGVVGVAGYIVLIVWVVRNGDNFPDPYPTY
jgi:Domain of unknown function (DUF4190)